MSQEELERLAWERIDGTISDEDREHLEDLLAMDSDARRQFDELCRLNDELALAQTVEPPPELRARIDRTLVATSPRWRRRSLKSRAPRRSILYAAAGLVVGVVVGQLLIPAAPIDRPRATGAMVPRSERPAESLQLDLGDGAGSVALWHADSDWTAEVTLDQNVTVELVLHSDGAVPNVTAVSSLGAAAVRAIEHSDRLVMSSEGVGSTVTTFRLSGRVPALRLVLRAGDRVVAQGMLEGLTLE